MLDSLHLPTSQWLAVSDHTMPLCPEGIADVVESGSLVVEFTQPKDDGSVLLDYKSDAGWPRAFSIFQDTHAGIVILHRQGATAQRHTLPCPLPRNGDLSRLTYTWDGPARTCALRLEDTAGTWVLTAQGSNPMPLVGADLLALCAGQADVRRDASVKWFGVCAGAPYQPLAAWIGHRTPVETARGRVAADDLRIGDRVATLDNGYQPLRAIRRFRLPNRGRLAPVLLRAPFFAEHTDILVSQDQLTLLSGAAIEYLFGEDAVLAPAAALRDGNSALSDARRPVTNGIVLELDRPALIFADGCTLLCSADALAAPLPYRLLHNYEALPLLSLLGRGIRHSAA